MMFKDDFAFRQKMKKLVSKLKSHSF